MESLMDWIMDMLIPPMMIVIIVLCAAALFIGLPVLGYQLWLSSQSPTFELRKDKWTCSSDHSETSTTYVQSGKVMVPVTSTHTVCDTWSRR